MNSQTLTSSGSEVSRPQISINTPELQPAGIGKRFVASCIDGVILSALGWAISLPLGVGLAVIAGQTSDAAQALEALNSWEGIGLIYKIVTQFSGIIIGFAFAGYFYSKKGATPGKKLMGLRLIQTSKGKNVSFWRGAFRDNIGKLISLLVLFIGYLLPIFRSDKRALHDLLFDTQVVEIKHMNVL